MPTNRNIVLANDEVYHVFNRGVEKRPTFTHFRDYSRAIETIRFYQYSNPPIRYSKFLLLNKPTRESVLQSLMTHQKLVEIIAYCLMPNHFHFLLYQQIDKGVAKFTGNFANSYTKYFNTKHERIGNLFQGPFKAVLVEKDEQLLHVSRYIHLNPVTSHLIKPSQLETYKWSSFPEYIDSPNKYFCKTDIVLNQFPNSNAYKQFVLDQVDYARKLNSIRHLTLE